MLAAMALLALGKERMPRSWLWLFGIVIAGQILTLLISFSYHGLFFLSGTALNNLPLVLVAAVVLSAV